MSSKHVRWIVLDVVTLILFAAGVYILAGGIA